MKKSDPIPQSKGHAPIPIPKANDLVSIATIIDIIIERVLGQAAKDALSKDALRDARGTVRKKIEYAYKAAKKNRLRPPVKGQFVFGDLIRWARQKKGWEALKGLPETAPVVPKHDLRKVRNAHTAAYAVTDKNSEALLNAAYGRINELEQRVGVLQPEVDAQRAIQKRRAERKEALRGQGRLGGRPRGGGK